MRGDITNWIRSKKSMHIFIDSCLRGKLIAVETSSLLAEFENKNRCIRVRLVSEEIKNFDISHNCFLWPEYFIDLLCERWILCHVSTSVLCLHYRPETVHCRCVHLWNNFPFIITLFSMFTSFHVCLVCRRRDE